MDKNANPQQVVYTNKARCRDCYRCLRVCPVKAIRMKDGQAFVEEDRCMSCGTCIRNCPQGAKQYRRDIDIADELIASEAMVAVSIAPSLAAAFTPWEIKRLPSALRKLGFDYVSETANGAYHVAKESSKHFNETKKGFSISTACPAIVRYIELYRPDYLDFLLPLFSPMKTHAAMLKQQLGSSTRVVFIGPCVAKKSEADSDGKDRGELLVDCSLTFEELHQWFDEKQIDLKACEESAFDDTPAGDSRVFPLAGGSVRTAKMDTDMFSPEIVATRGIDELESVLDSDLEPGQKIFIEPLFCEHGCIDGPAIGTDKNVYDRRKGVLEYEAREGSPCAEEEPVEPKPIDPDLIKAQYGHIKRDEEEAITEDQIRQVFAKTGKALPEDQLNCGACGYSSCRDKAIAVIRGMAEPEMCIPYMRRLAEQRTDRIIETSPNGIVIVNEELEVLSMNGSFRRFFMCSEAFIGKRISDIMDPEPFIKLISGEDLVDVEVHHASYNLVCRQILYPLREEKQYVGIFVNITNSQENQRKLDEMRAQTVMQAQELLDHQMSMARKIAVFLGESTAKGEQLVENLIQMSEKPDEKDEKKDDIKRGFRPYG